MDTAQMQQSILDSVEQHAKNETKPPIWDPRNGTFHHSVEPFVWGFPAAVVVLILLCYLLKPLTQFRPVWLSNFVQEPKYNQDGQHKNRASLRTAFMGVACLAGLSSQLVTMLYPSPNVFVALPACCWLLSTFFVAIKRPNTASISLLLLHSSIVLSMAVVILQKSSHFELHDVPIVIALTFAVVAVVVNLNMPLRDPSSSKDDICPAFSTPTNTQRSPEDDLTLWQFFSVSWMTPLISLGHQRQLHDGDVWFLAYEFQHERLHYSFRDLTGSFVMKLIKANGIDLIITSFLGIVRLMAELSMPILLQQLLKSMEDEKTPRRVSITIACLSFAVKLLSTQFSVLSTWYTRRSYERSRGEMVTMIHAKTLTRKIVTSTATPKTEQLQAPLREAGPDNSNIMQKTIEKLRQCFGRLKKWSTSKSASDTAQSSEAASTGKILNLVRGDAYEVAQRFWEFPKFITVPLRLIMCVILIWNFLGWPCLIGASTVLIAQAINAVIIKIRLRWEKLRRDATDKQLNKVSQVVESIRHLRWYGWQDAWLTDVLEARQRELNIRIVVFLIHFIMHFMNTLSSGLFPVVAFWAYTTLAGLPLRIDVAFPALQLFDMLQDSIREVPGLITTLLNAYVAVSRINNFMEEEDIPSEKNSNSRQLQIQGLTLAWPGNAEPVLQDLTMAFPQGLTVLCGGVGSGKTALLQGILGELDVLSGDVVRPDEIIGYCAQTPWLESMSIRENILFSSPYRKDRYEEVLDACALVPDLASFKDGDMSDLGENGVGLSGGQRARVALARAMYSEAKILLLDDPISALDYQTSELVVHKCLRGPLAEGRTIILVTHRLELCQGLAEQVIEISEGRARHMTEDVPIKRNTSSAMAAEGADLQDADQQGAEKDKEPNEGEAPDKFLEDEHREHGDVKFSVYWEYIKAGKLKWWAVLVCVAVGQRSIEYTRNWFLKEWGERYDSVNQFQNSFSRSLFDRLPPPETNVKPWLVGFLLFALATSASALLIQLVMLLVFYTAGRRMFIGVMHRVCYATFRFYDVTPVGRLMNRVTSDMHTIDGNLGQLLYYMSTFTIIWIISILAIASATPVFLIFSLVLVAAYGWIFFRFLPTSQSLRRLEMVSLTPLLSNFGVLLNGLTTVRAFRAQTIFQKRIIENTDHFQRMDHFYWSLQTWLSYRLGALSAVSNFLLIIIALFTGISSGLTAFVLIASSRFVASTSNICRVYGELQMDFVSVERIVELLHLEQEPSGQVDPPASWPSYNGDIVFDNVTIRYAPHLDPVLESISLCIRGGSNTAIIGRTGSGKSTLALSLLATVRAESGTIHIDGMDLSTINTQALRTRVTFLAQDPVLFPGSIRQNLDPLDQHTDQECDAVLQRICHRHSWTLETELDTGGNNLSQGQRQLIGLTRAVLRRSAIVIFDEATASIDRETSMEIQQVITEELRESTVITIAHRVEAVRDADYCVVLDGGRIVREGPVEISTG